MCNCKDCIYRTKNSDGTKTMQTRDGMLICTLGFKTKVEKDDTCFFSRSDNEGQMNLPDLINLIKTQPIEFIEDGCQKKLTGMEKIAVNKFIKNNLA